MKLPFLLAVGSMLAVLPGCSSSRAVELGVVLQNGNCQRARAGVTKVTMDEVAALRGARLLGVEPAPSPTPPPSPTDAATPLMIAISRGERPTAGYGLALDGPAVLDGGVLGIRVKQTEPPPDSIQAQMITHPCLVLELPDAPWTTVRVLDADGTEIGQIGR